MGFVLWMAKWPRINGFGRRRKEDSGATCALEVVSIFSCDRSTVGMVLITEGVSFLEECQSPFWRGSVVRYKELRHTQGSMTQPSSLLTTVPQAQNSNTIVQVC